MTKRCRLHINMPPKLLEQVRKLADKEMLDMSTLVRRLLHKAINGKIRV